MVAERGRAFTRVVVAVPKHQFLTMAGKCSTSLPTSLGSAGWPAVVATLSGPPPGATGPCPAGLGNGGEWLFRDLFGALVPHGSLPLTWGTAERKFGLLSCGAAAGELSFLTRVTLR